MTTAAVRLERARLASDAVKSVAGVGRDVALEVLRNPVLSLVGGVTLIELLQRVELDAVPTQWETVTIRSPEGGWHHETVTRKVRTPLISQEFATMLEATLASSTVASSLMASGGGFGGLASLVKLFAK